MDVIVPLFRARRLALEVLIRANYPNWTPEISLMQRLCNPSMLLCYVGKCFGPL